MAFWGRVWRIGTTPDTTPAACYNITSVDQITSTTPGILTDLPVTVASVQEAIGYWLDQLRRRVSATITATNQSEVLLNITIRRGTRTDEMTWLLSSTQGKYPLVVSLTTPVDQYANINFYNMGQALDWIVQKLA